MSGNLYLGVDLGTTALKAGVYDAAGDCLATGRSAYALYSPREDWAEQPAESWWQAFESVLRELRGQVDSQRIRAVCVVGQGPTAVPVDEAGRPLRAAITWADRRAVRQAQRLQQALGGSDVNIEFEVLPRIMWIGDEEPEILERTRWFFQPYDYLSFLLTGEAVTVRPLDSLPPWTSERLAAAGLDRSRFPPRSVPPGEILGVVREELAESLGLAPDTVVVSGTVDAFSHWIGVDLNEAGVMCNTGGTSEGVSLAWNEKLSDPAYRVFPLPSPFGSGWIIGGAMSNSGGLLDWAANTFTTAGREATLLAASQVAPGSDGLIALPYFRGERTPIYDPHARGCFFGVNMSHSSAHFSRSLLEGVAFGLRQIIEICEEMGASVSGITVSGGTALAGVWNRIKADVTGRPVRVPAVKESGTLGAAILACAAASDRPLSEVSCRMVRFAEVIEPNSESKAVYDTTYPLFLELYQALREPYRRLTQLAQGRPESRS